MVRGPVANIYGSGAIGGVASFRTKDIEDMLRPGERWGVLTHTAWSARTSGKGMGSVFAGARVTPNVDIFAGGVYRTSRRITATATATNGRTPAPTPHRHRPS